MRLRTTCTVAATVASLLACASVAWAQTKTFDIATQPAADGIQAFARQAGLQILVRKGDVEGKQVKGLKGALEVRDGLARLLEGTDLAVISNDGHTVTLSLASQPQAPVRESRPVTKDQSEAPARTESARADGVAEVIVTAQKRVEKAQDVPMAVTAFNEAALQKIGFTNMMDISEKVPALDIVPGFRSSSALKLYMRGVGQESPDQLAKDNGIGVYLDDVYVGHGLGLSSDLSDVERVEVLPGPQGTLYGRNTLGGAIKFISSKPTGTFGLKQSLDIGDYGLFRSLTSVNLPEVAHVSTKLTLVKSDFGGWVKNPGSAGDFGSRNNLGWRAALRWRPTDSLTADYTYDHSDNKGVSDYLQHGYHKLFEYIYHFPVFTSRLDTAWRAANAPMYDNFNGDGHALTVAWDFRPNTQLKSVTAYREYVSGFRDDAVEAWNTPTYQGLDTRERQFTQEFLLTGSLANNSISYHVGAFHFQESGDQRSLYQRLDFVVTTPYTPPTAADLRVIGYYQLENKSNAIYGQITWIPPILDERLSIDVGGRESWDTRSVVQNNYNNLPPKPITATGEVSYSSFDPSLTLDYKWTSRIHTYAKVAKAYIAGGFDAQYNTTYAIPYKPEHMLSTEVGLKSRWWQDRLLFNITAFDQQYKDIQLRFSATPTLTSPGFSETINAGHAGLRGVETQLEIVPVTGLTLGANTAYLNQDLTVANPFTGTITKGGLPYAPKWKIESSAEYVFVPLSFGTVSARVSYSYHDKELPSGGAGSGTYDTWKGQYNLWDARVTLSDIPVTAGNLSVALYGKNLADKQYMTYNSTGAVMYGPPRNYGLNVLYKY